MKFFESNKLHKETLEQIKGGQVYIICPCGSRRWEITTVGDTTTMVCLICGRTYTYPAI